MNARYFDPQLGTFISPDTIVPDPGVVIDYNRYAYARANPLKFNDPSGHCGTLAATGGTTVAVDLVCWEIMLSPAGPAALSVGLVGGVMVYGYVNSTFDLPPVPPIYPETLPGGFTAPSPIPGSTTVTSGVELIPIGDSAPSTAIPGSKGVSVPSTNVLNSASVDEQRRNINKGIQSLQEQITEHQKKLQDYIANPDAYDNQGYLKNAPNEQVRQRIIQGRINHLETEIRTFQRNIEKLVQSLNQLK